MLASPSVGVQSAPAATVALTAADTTAGTAPSAIDPAAPLGLDASPRLLVINATVGVEVADVSAAVSQVVSLAARHGGQVYGSDVQLGDGTEPRGTLTLKLPPAKVEDAIAELASVGTVISRTQNTDDVTQQSIDLDVRIASQQQSVDRVRALLADTKDLNEVVRVESELTNRETELERLQALKRDLAGQTALATLTVQLSKTPIVTPITEPAPIVKSNQRPGIGHAFSTGWRVFVNTLAAILVVIGLAAPFLATVGAGLALVWWLSRRQQRRLRNRSVVPPTPPAAAEDQRTSPLDSEEPARSR